MTIKQFNASYLAPDDRLLFRLNTVNDEEFRFWFTRRITIFILSATNHLMIKSLEQAHSPEAAKAMKEFGEKGVVLKNEPSLKASIGEPHDQSSEKEAAVYQPASQYPLGADPVLVIDVKCAMEKQDSEDILSLDLILPAGANINLKLAGHTLHAMTALLNQLREHASWGEIPSLAIPAKEVEDETSKDPAPTKPLVH